MALPTTRQLPYEPEKLRSANIEEHLSQQKKLIKELTLMYEDIARAHNSLVDAYTALEARVTALEP